MSTRDATRTSDERNGARRGPFLDLTLDGTGGPALNRAMPSTETAVGTPDDPRYWRQRAQDAHSLAEQMHNASARGIMLDIALRYEAMAKSKESRGGPAAKKAD
jgi:hypothetical protein